MGTAGGPKQGLKITPKYVSWNATGSGANRTLTRITQVELIGDGAGNAVANLRAHGLDLGVRSDHPVTSFGIALVKATDATPTSEAQFTLLSEDHTLSRDLSKVFKQPGTVGWYGYRIAAEDLPTDPGVAEHLFIRLVLTRFQPGLVVTDPSQFKRDFYVMPVVAKLPSFGWDVHYALGMSVLTIGRDVAHPGSETWIVEDFDVSACGIEASP